MKAAIEVPYRFAEPDSPTRVVDLAAWFQLANLDEDWAIPCEIGRDAPDDNVIGCRGANPADFILWPVHCCPRKERPILSCKRCLADLLSDPLGVSCAWCRTSFMPGVTALRLIEPLNRRPQ